MQCVVYLADDAIQGDSLTAACAAPDSEAEEITQDALAVFFKAVR